MMLLIAGFCVAGCPLMVRTCGSTESDTAMRALRACCESAPRALPTIALSQQRAQCAKKDCEVACSPNIECAKVERADAFVARCKDGTCTAVHR